MPMDCSRREWAIRAAGWFSGTYLATGLSRAAAAPTAPVSVAKCQTYNPAELVPALERMFDQLGGLGRLVKGTTVAIKVNLTGAPTYRLGYLPLEDTDRKSTRLTSSHANLMGKAGARRIR